MGRFSRVGLAGCFAIACAGPAKYPGVGGVVSEARADQLSFASEYQKKGLAFRGTVQKKGIKPSTATGFEFSGSDFGTNGGGFVVGAGTARRVNVNYGYVFVADDADQTKRALCLFEPDNLKEAATLEVGKAVVLTCLFSKFVGGEAQPTPVFWGCSIIE